MHEETEAPTKPVFGRFKLMAGVHSEGGKVYEKDDVFDSASDLSKHNAPGMQAKFVPADSVTKATVETTDDEDGFEEMSLKELRDWAAEGEVDLEGCGSNKKKIIERLKASNT